MQNPSAFIDFCLVRYLNCFLYPCGAFTTCKFRFFRAVQFKIDVQVYQSFPLSFSGNVQIVCKCSGKTTIASIVNGCRFFVSRKALRIILIRRINQSLFLRSARFIVKKRPARDVRTDILAHTSIVSRTKNVGKMGTKANKCRYH